MNRRGGLETVWGRLVVVATAVMAVCSLALLPASTPAGAAVPTVSVAVHGSATARRGAVTVNYLATGRVTGTVHGARQGQRVQLLAQPFPFTGPYRQQGAQAARRNGTYVFRVHPAVATRYEVRLAGAHGVRSRAVTLYVVSRPTGFHYASSPGCSSPAPTTCQLTVTETVVLPPKVAKGEVAKRRYVYLGVTLAHSHTASPPPPKVLRLQRQAHLSVTARATPGRYATAVVLHYRVDRSFRQSGWHAGWAVEWCTKETFSADGFGLPFHYGCGRRSVPNRPVALRSLG